MSIFHPSTEHFIDTDVRRTSAIAMLLDDMLVVLMYVSIDRMMEAPASA